MLLYSIPLVRAFPGGLLLGSRVRQLNSSSGGTSSPKSLLGLFGNQLNVAVGNSRPVPGRNETSHDDVLLQAAQVVDLSADRSLREHARRFLERCGRNERFGRERRLRDSEQQRTARCRLAAGLLARARSLPGTGTYRPARRSRNSVSPTSSILIQRIICRTMTSMCLSLMLTPCRR